MPEVQDSQEGYAPEMNTRDIEEKQKILKDRLLLIGQNLVEFKEKNEEEILKLKKEIESLKLGFDKIKDFLETISGELGKFAKKEDLEILKKQARMFQPMEFVTRGEFERSKVKIPTPKPKKKKITKKKPTSVKLKKKKTSK